MCGGSLAFMENLKAQNLALNATDSAPAMHGQNNLIIMQKGIYAKRELAMTMVPNETVMTLVPHSEVKTYLAAVGC